MTHPEIPDMVQRLAGLSCVMTGNRPIQEGWLWVFLQLVPVPLSALPLS